MLEKNDEKKFAQLYAVFKKLTKGSKLLSISDDLSNAMYDRFGVKPDTVSNGVDPAFTRQIFSSQSTKGDLGCHILVVWIGK